MKDKNKIVVVCTLVRSPFGCRVFVKPIRHRWHGTKQRKALCSWCSLCRTVLNNVVEYVYNASMTDENPNKQKEVQ